MRAQRVQARDLFVKTFHLVSLAVETSAVRIVVPVLLLTVLPLYPASLGGLFETAPVLAFIALFIVGAVSLSCCLYLQRLLVALAHGTKVDRDVLLTTATKRVADVVGAYIAVFVAFAGLIVAPMILGSYVHPSLYVLLALPVIAMFVLGSQAFVFASLLIAGPRGSAFKRTQELTTGRWWLILRMQYVIGFVALIVSLPVGMISTAVGLVSGVAGLAVETLGVAISLLYMLAGFAASHEHLGLPIDPSLQTGERTTTIPPEMMLASKVSNWQNKAAPLAPSSPNLGPPGARLPPPPPASPNPRPPTPWDDDTPSTSK